MRRIMVKICNGIRVNEIEIYDAVTCATTRVMLLGRLNKKENCVKSLIFWK